MLIGGLHKIHITKIAKTGKKIGIRMHYQIGADDTAPGANEKFLQAEIDHDKGLCRFLPRQKIDPKKKRHWHIAYSLF